MNRDLEKHDYANTCMDDFLTTKEDARWTEGVERLPPEQRAIAAATLAIEAAAGNPPSAAAAISGGETADGSGGVEMESVVPMGGTGAVSAVSKMGGPRLGNLKGLGGGAVEEQEDEEEDEEDVLHDMEHHNEYLRAKPVRVQFVCAFVKRGAFFCACVVGGTESFKVCVTGCDVWYV